MQQKMQKNFLRGIALLSVAMMIVPVLTNAETLKRNETVYVSANSAGKPDKIEVVTYLATNGSGKAVDYTSLSNIENIYSSLAPEIEKNRVVFNSSERNLFYRGTTTKQLPVEIRIEYFLNGKKMDFASLNGKSGDLKIKIYLRNTTGAKQDIRYTAIGTGKNSVFNDYVYIPFIVQGHISFDLNKFSDVKSANGVFAVVGSHMKMNWLTFPLPEQVLEVTAHGENIEMPCLMFELIPGKLPLPDIDLATSLNKIYSGTDTIGGYLAKMSEGAQQINDGQKQLGTALTQMKTGSDQLLLAMDAQSQMVNGVIKIDTEMMKKLRKYRWIKSMNDLYHYIDISSQMLDMTANGGPIKPDVKKFLTEQGKTVPEIAEFPGMNITTNGVKQMNGGLVQMIDGNNKLIAGTNDLNVALVRVHNEGTEELKKGLVDGSEVLLKKLAQIKAGEKRLSDYKSYTGLNNNVESSVQFVVRTPGIYTP